jgi:hypothetical protein
MLPAVLLTEINSDLPGDVLAQVAHDVYDSRDQQALLIPKGARLIGTYDSDVSSNQRRLFVAWTRVIFPDGRSLALPGLETKDRSGAGGVADRVEQHRRRTFGTAALLSLVGAGAQLAQPNGGYGPVGAYPSAGQVAAGAAGQQLAQVATEMLRKQMDVQPTIRIRRVCRSRSSCARISSSRVRTAGSRAVSTSSGAPTRPADPPNGRPLLLALAAGAVYAAGWGRRSWLTDWPTTPTSARRSTPHRRCWRRAGGWSPGSWRSAPSSSPSSAVVGAAHPP